MTEKETGKKAWQKLTPIERKATLDKMLANKEITPTEYVSYERRINDPAIFKTRKSEPWPIVIKQPKADAISKKALEPRESTQSGGIDTITEQYKRLPKPEPQIKGDKQITDKTVDFIDKEGNLIQRVREFSEGPSPEEKARQDAEQKLRMEKQREFNEKRARERIERLERIKKGIPLERGDAQATPTFEIKLDTNQIRGVPNPCTTLKFEKVTIDEYDPNKQRHLNSRPIGTHQEMRWQPYDTQGSHIYNGKLEVDKNGIPTRLILRRGDGEQCAWNLKIDVSAIPKSIQSLIRTNIRKDFKETVKKAEKLIESQELEIAELKKEIAKRKLAMAKTQKYVRDHSPKRSRWNPFKI